VFYDRYVALCSQRGIKPSAAAEQMKISKTTVTNWKKNPAAIPSGDVLQKVASYFGVTVDSLLGRDEPAADSRLEGVYFNFAKDAQDNGIDPEDIRLAIETIKRLRGK
jgi:transcriptional regulator with XRE-family HTH domain